MLLHIPGVFTKDEVATLRLRLDAGPWVDGNVTSGHQSATAKLNRQLPEDSAEARERGAAAREHALARFGLARFLADWDQVLHSAVQGAAQRPAQAPVQRPAQGAGAPARPGDEDSDERRRP